MKKRFLLTIIMACVIAHVFGQNTIVISLDDRNKAIEYTKEAFAEIQNSNYDLALQKLQKSIETDSTFRGAYLHLYQVGMKGSNCAEKVITALNKGIRIFEDDDELIFYRGEIYRLNKDFDNALTEYSKAITYSKTNGEDYYLVPYYYLNRGNIYLKSKRYEQALIDYNHLLELDSTSTSGLTNRGITLFKLGETEKACRDWSKAAQNGYKNANVYYKRNCTN